MFCVDVLLLQVVNDGTITLIRISTSPNGLTPTTLRSSSFMENWAIAGLK
jgi:hypothetical protein